MAVSKICAAAVPLLLTALCLAIVFVPQPAAAARRSSVFGITFASLLSGGLTSCSGVAVNSSACINGMASAAQVVRWLEGNTSMAVKLIPYVDRDSAFVQMHPLTWAVNVLVMQQLGLSVVAAPPSLFVQKIVPGWENFFNSSLQILSSNALMLASSPWIRPTIFYTIHENLAILIMDPTLDTNVVDTFAAIDTMLLLIELNRLATVTVVVSGSPIMSAQVFYGKLLTRKPHIVVQQGTTGDPYLINDTLIVPLSGSTTLASFVNISYDDVTRLVNATAFSKSLTVPPFMGDAKYYADQTYLDGIAQAAAINDPVLGTSQSPMPVHRNGTYRLCLGGSCPGGRLFTEGMRHAFSCDIAFSTSGAFRGLGWNQGAFKVSDVWGLYPFANTICEGTITGLSIWEMFNFSLGLSTAPNLYLTATGDRLLQFAGMKVAYNPTLSGSRLIDIQVFNRARNEFEPLQRLKLYTWASESFTATISVPFPTFLSARYAGEVAPKCRGTILQVAVAEYAKTAGTIDPLAPANLVDVTAAGSRYTAAQHRATINWTQGLDVCPANTFWVENRGTCMPCPKGQVAPPSSLLCGAPVSQTDESSKLYIGILVGVVAFILLVFLGRKLYKSKRLRFLLHSGLPMMVFRVIVLSGTMILYCFAVYTVFSESEDRVFIIVYFALTAVAGCITLLEIFAIVRYFLQQAEAESDLDDDVLRVWKFYFGWLKLLSLGLKDAPQLALAFVAVTQEDYIVVIISLCIASIFFGTKIADVVDLVVDFIKVNVLNVGARKITNLRQLGIFITFAFRISKGKIHNVVPALPPNPTDEELEHYQKTMIQLFPQRAREIRWLVNHTVHMLEKRTITMPEFAGLFTPILYRHFVPKHHRPLVPGGDSSMVSIMAAKEGPLGPNGEVSTGDKSGMAFSAYGNPFAFESSELKCEEINSSGDTPSSSVRREGPRHLSK